MGEGPIDNSELVAQFIQEKDDDDTFWYTELLDRTTRSRGSNRVRILRTFFHRSREDFWRRWPVIKTLCEQTDVRAYTRLSPRSYAKVGKLFAQSTVAMALSGNFNGMAYLYSSACGSVTPNEKFWLIDVDDELTEHALAMLWPNTLIEKVARIPSRQGCHFIVKPFNRAAIRLPAGASLHLDNPTNLYIPAKTESVDG